MTVDVNFLFDKNEFNPSHNKVWVGTFEFILFYQT